MRDLGTTWMPTDPPRPAPPVLTAEDVCTILRLSDEAPPAMLARLAKFDGLPVLSIRGKNMVSLYDLLRWLHSQRVGGYRASTTRKTPEQVMAEIEEEGGE